MKELIDRNLKLSKNFTLKELIEGPAIDDVHYEKFWDSLNPFVIENLKYLCTEALQPVRDYFGLPIIVLCGFRPLWYERLKGRSGNSTHTAKEKNVAAGDIYGPQISLSDLYNYFQKRGWKGGLAMSPKDGFLHVDTKFTNPPRRWSY